MTWYKGEEYVVKRGDPKTVPWGMSNMSNFGVENTIGINDDDDIGEAI